MALMDSKQEHHTVYCTASTTIYKGGVTHWVAEWNQCWCTISQHSDSLSLKKTVAM